MLVKRCVDGCFVKTMLPSTPSKRIENALQLSKLKFWTGGLCPTMLDGYNTNIPIWSYLLLNPITQMEQKLVHLLFEMRKQEWKNDNKKKLR